MQTFTKLFSVALAVLLSSTAILAADLTASLPARVISGTVGAADVVIAAPPLSCSINVTAISAQTAYTNGQLTQIVWTASGSAACTIVMPSITLDIFAVDPVAVRHSVASGSVTNGLAAVATNNNYTCVQATSGTCGGTWQVGYNATFTAPPPFTWGSGGGCTAVGRTLTCTTVQAFGTIPASRT